MAGAIFASRVVNDLYGINAQVILPREILYRNNSQIEKVFLFSYSGTTNDLIEGTREIDNNKKISYNYYIKDKENVMRKNIYKYKLEDSHNPRVTGKVVMPLGAEILSCAMDYNGDIVFYALADPCEQMKVSMDVVVLPTGASLSEETQEQIKNMKFEDTFVDCNKNLVWHVWAAVGE